MKKLLLTSAGFLNPKVKDEFLNLLSKPTFKIKILFIPTASRTKEELHYVEESKNELLEMGIIKENLIVYNLDREISEKVDVIYVCGGNTFYLLHKIQESNFGKKIKEMVDKGVVYVGVSAGSILAGPDISISSRGETWDKNDVGIKDLTGLGLTDVIVSPHYEDKEEGIIRKFEEETNNKVTTLTDQQALLILGNKIKVIE